MQTNAQTYYFKVNVDNSDYSRYFQTDDHGNNFDQAQIAFDEIVKSDLEYNIVTLEMVRYHDNEVETVFECFDSAQKFKEIRSILKELKAMDLPFGEPTKEQKERSSELYNELFNLV